MKDFVMARKNFLFSYSEADDEWILYQSNIIDDCKIMLVFKKMQ